jgi:hypothetical protein
MNRGTRVLFLAMAASAALIAGCGGGASSTTSTPSSTSASSPSSSTTSTTTVATTSSSGSQTAGPIPSPGSAGAVVAAYCKSALAAAKTRISASERSQFEAYCASLTHDSPAQIKAAEKTLCNEIIKDSVPVADRTIASTVCAKL